MAAAIWFTDVAVFGLWFWEIDRGGPHMRDGRRHTEVEKTMIELRRGRVVKETRSAFQEAMQHRFIAEVERLSGCEVIGFVSDPHVGPDMGIELSLLEEFIWGVS